MKTKNEKVESKFVPIGERMIEIELRFYTNRIASGKGYIIPKHCWTGGAVRVKANKAHGIKAQRPRQFHSLFEILPTIEKVLIDSGIQMHISTRQDKTVRYLKHHKKRMQGEKWGDK